MACCEKNSVASSGGRSSNTDESDGGAPVDIFLSLVRALIGCGASADVAAQSAATFYASQSHTEPVGSAVSGVSSARAERSKRRQETWQASMSVLPYQDGQCYLHTIRWGCRKSYAKELGVSPTFSKFVAKLRRGDFDERVAKEMYLYRVSPKSAFGANVVYHVASECADGVLISSVYDAIAGFQRLYPWVNKEYVLEGPGVESISLVGSVGRVPATPAVGVPCVVSSGGNSSDSEVTGLMQGDVAAPGVFRESDSESEGLDRVSMVTSDSQESEGCLDAESAAGHERLDLFLPLAEAEQVLGSGRDWVSVTESGGPAETRGGVFLVVPLGVTVSLSSGTVVVGRGAGVALLLASTISVVQVSPPHLLFQQVLGRSLYASLECCVTGGCSGGVVVQLRDSPTSDELNRMYRTFGNGLLDVRVTEAQRYRSRGGDGCGDSLTVGVASGRVRTGPVVLLAGQQARCVARAGVVDVTMEPLAVGTLVRLVGFVDCDCTGSFLSR